MKHRWVRIPMNPSLKKEFKKKHLCIYCECVRHTDFYGFVQYTRNMQIYSHRPECWREDEPAFQEAMGIFNH